MESKYVRRLNNHLESLPTLTKQLLELSILVREASWAMEMFGHILLTHSNSEVAATPFGTWRGIAGDAIGESQDIRDGLAWARFMEKHIFDLGWFAQRLHVSVDSIGYDEIINRVNSWRAVADPISGGMARIYLERHHNALKAFLDSRAAKPEETEFENTHPLPICVSPSRRHA